MYVSWPYENKAKQRIVLSRQIDEALWGLQVLVRFFADVCMYVPTLVSPLITTPPFPPPIPLSQNLFATAY